MLVHKKDSVQVKKFDAYRNLYIEKEINKLDILRFEIPVQYENIFEVEALIETEEKIYVIKSIEVRDDYVQIEAKEDITPWYSFKTSLNFPYKKIDDVINGIKPTSWTMQWVGDPITVNRTVTADHKMAYEVLEELKKKYECEIRLDNKNKIIYVGKEIGEDKGVLLTKDLNVVKKNVTTESFDFATRIIPEGKNHLMIDAINNGKNYLENKAYSYKTITYYWKDERYTNIQNLKNDAQKKLDELSKPKLSIELEIKNLAKIPGFEHMSFDIGDILTLLDPDKKVKEKFRVVKGEFYEANSLDDKITLNNTFRDLVTDEQSVIELTNEYWERTRTRFEAVDGEISGFVETAKNYTDESFKTYISERKQTDQAIYEKIAETTTYVDPITGQTEPIINKALEINKNVEGIQIDIVGTETRLNEKLKDTITKTQILTDPEIRTALKGADGKDGKDGAPGRDGVNGKDGAPGATGPRGPQGPQGLQGVKGADGKNGIDGKDGKDGYTPTPNSNTNTWWINGRDTGVKVSGDDPKIIDGMWWVGNRPTNVRAMADDLEFAYADDIQGSIVTNFSLTKKTTSKFIGIYVPRWHGASKTDPKNYQWLYFNQGDIYKTIKTIDDIQHALQINKQQLQNVKSIADKAASDIVEVNASVTGLNTQQKKDIKDMLEKIEMIRILAGNNTDGVDENLAKLDQLEDMIREQMADVYLGYDTTNTNIVNMQQALNGYIDNLPDTIKAQIQDDEFIKQAKMHFDFSMHGLVIGKDGNKYTVELDNESLKFKYKGELVAYINAHRLNILEAEILEKFKIHNLLFTKYKATTTGTEYVIVNWVNGSYGSN